MNCSHYDVCFVYNGEYFDIDRNKDTNMKICKYFLDKNILIRPPFKNNDCVYIITKPCFDNKYQIIKCVVHNMRISRMYHYQFLNVLFLSYHQRKIYFQ